MKKHKKNNKINERSLNVLELFAGAGGGILAGELLGWRTVCAVEIEPYAASVLIQRQNDGILPPFPIWDDVRTFDGRPWKKIVDVVSGGFPCQDISACKRNAKGIKGEKSGLWSEMARIICEVQPKYVFVENVAALRFRGLDKVLGGLAQMGYNAAWGVLGGNALQKYGLLRKRLWIVGKHQSLNGNAFSEVHKKADIKLKTICREIQINLSNAETSRLVADSLAAGEIDDVAEWMDRFAALGNGQMAGVAAFAWAELIKRL